MRLACTAAAAAALLAAGAISRAEDAPKPKDYSHLFKVLDKPDGKDANAGINAAVGKFDHAIARSRAGERTATNSNLEYNEKRLAELRRQEAAQEEYLSTFWERVAIHFENLKKEYGGDENDKGYRKAALALQEEFQQREADAKAALARTREDIGRVQVRLAELGNRKKLNQLEDDLRATDFGPEGGNWQGEKKALPSRADKALAMLGELSRRKVERRVALLVGAAPMRSSADDYFDRQIEEMLEGE